MTCYETLLGRGLIKQFKAEPSQIEAQLKLAQRDLKAASEMLDKNLDWAFNIAYNAHFASHSRINLLRRI